MGAFYLVCDPDPAERKRLASALDSALFEQGFGEGESIHRGHVVACFHGKLCGAAPQVHVAPDGRFAALCGTALLAGCSGAEAARRMLDTEAAAGPDFSQLVGNFCAVVGDGRQVRLFLDPFGVYKVYTTPDRRVFSSSFIALAQALGGITPDAQGVYEYVHQEATYGESTVAREIRLARPSGHYEFDDVVRWVPSPASWTPPPVEDDSETVLFANVLHRLRDIYSQIARCFGDAVDTALSGGYDSRLTLALLREQGLNPAIHVYGQPTSGDVVIAREIAKGEGLDLEVVDKSRWPVPTNDQVASIVKRNYLAFDGWPAGGIFDWGADLATRLERAQGGRLMLNGGGGEIFRNFFYLPARSFAPIEVIWSFYNRYVARWCTGAFHEGTYLDALASKLAEAVGGGDRLSREQVEYAYPAFRCGFWMGRNSSINSRLGWSLTPFIDRDLVRLAVAIPLRVKNHGRFEGRLIQAVSPSLSRYLSDYGHAFDRPPPIRRVIKDYATLLRPSWIRRRTYRLRFRNAVQRPAYLRPDLLSRSIDLQMPVMSEYFHPERVNDPAAYARIATLEYLFGESRS